MSPALEIARALGNVTREGRGWRCRCPVHDGVSLNLADGRNGLLVHCWGVCGPLDVLAELRHRGFVEDRLGTEFRREVSQPSASPRTGVEDRIGRALDIWPEAMDARGTPAELYLNSRGLKLPNRYHEIIRFHDACPFKGQRVPAMVTLLRDIHTDVPCGIHRTALLLSGSDRDRDLGKAMLGRAAGAVIKLSPDDEVTLGLGLAEGLETGLAVMGLGWRPIWSCASAGAISNFPVLSGIEELTIFADRDGNGVGQQAAQNCCRRWCEAGLPATIRVPWAADTDWCDASRAAQ